MVREILVEWVTPAGSTDRSVTYWDPAMAVHDQRVALGAFLAGTNGTRSNQITWNVANFGRELDAGTGAVTGAWTDSGNVAGAGTVESQPMPDAVQIVMRWSTGVVINGRFLRGRQFFPGSALGAVSGGNVTPATQNVFNTAGAALIASAKGFCIWHRPVLGAGGSSQPVLSGVCWNEFGTLRRRRR